eukprot:COSAG03_NODE_19882_length_328_cov_0.877729_2_plen_42_part_01
MASGAIEKPFLCFATTATSHTRFVAKANRCFIGNATCNRLVF